MSRTRIFPIVLGALGMVATLPANATTFTIAAPGPHIELDWSACPGTWVGPLTHAIASRAQCSTVTAPLDHAAPDGRTAQIGIIRIRAADMARRAGSIFFNSGGPGEHPGVPLVSMAQQWAGMPSTRELGERYDLVAVIPRGLVGSEAVQCVTGMPRRVPVLPWNDNPDDWQLIHDEAQSIVDACAAEEHARYINTEQHVHDMDLVRRALGDERLNFYGISYGGTAGAWYASIFPEHIDRMLLDSSIDFTRDFRTAARIAANARHRVFHDGVVEPLLDDPVRYGLGNDRDGLFKAIVNLPTQLRTARVPLESPQAFAAALHVADILRVDNPPTLRAMSSLLRRPFVDDADLDNDMHMEARRVASKIYEAPLLPRFNLGPDGDSVRLLVACNDSVWNRNDEAIYIEAREDALRYTSAAGDDILEELVCTRWGGPNARRPSLAHLQHTSPFLLIQSDKDTATPLTGAARIVDRFENARLLLVRDSRQHGVLNTGLSPCAEETAARYLLTGSLPVSDSRVLACAVDRPPGALPEPVTEPLPSEVDEP